MCKGYIYKVLMMSALASALVGCANQQGRGPQVRDLSDASQAVENSPQYTVKAGDTLYGIAWQHNLDYRELAAINNIEAPYQIRPGQKIALREDASATANNQSPAVNNASEGGGAVATGLSTQTASVASDEQELDWLMPDESAIQRNQRLTAEREARDAAEQVADSSASNEASESESAPETEVVAATSERQEPDAEPAQQPAPQPEPAPEEASSRQSASEDRSSRTYTPADTIDWQWPAAGDVVGEFGQGDSITAGIDITGEKGQPIKAAGPGIVVYAGSGVRGYGNLILLKHNDQFLSAYAHNDSLRVSENDVVEAGEVIATMGDSDAENVRLHFEVRRDGQPQDPLDFLPSR